MPSVKRKDAVLAAADRAVEAMVAEKDADYLPVKEPPFPVSQPSRPCALEHAPVGSKVVASRTTEGVKQVRLITPDDEMLLPLDDVAYGLPIGAKVRRKAPTIFEGMQLDFGPQTPFVASSARAVLTGFRAHFFPQD